MLAALGKVERERTLFAPDAEEERPDWQRLYDRAQENYRAVIAGLSELYPRLPHPMRQYLDQLLDPQLPAINTKSLAKLALTNTGWVKADSGSGFGVCYQKPMGEGLMTVMVDSIHRGHHLQTLLRYESPYFCFNDTLKLYCEPLNETESRQYFLNLICVLRHIEEELNARSQRS